MFSVGQVVELVVDPNVVGVITEQLPAVNGECRYRVFHSLSSTREYYESQLAVHEERASDSSEDEEVDFLYQYAWQKLTAKPQSSMFSLNAGKIKFIPYQFRPLRRIIQAERPRILIADEVGVGKTIETGMILKEYEKRNGVESVAIICPKELTTKWRHEMKNRFDETFQILDAPVLDRCLSDLDMDGSWPISYKKCIIGLEMLRREQNIKKLNEADDAFRFDMLVVDEAHHVVNSKGNSHRVVKKFCDNSDVAVFLSATPIQLKSDDLFSLLSLLYPEEFNDKSTYASMVEPNKNLNAAIRYIRNPNQEQWQESALEELLKVPVASEWSRARYENNALLRRWTNRLSDFSSPLQDEERVACLRDLEDLRSFSHVINRTKRRDIGKFTIREPIAVEVSYDESERRFYEAARSFEYAVQSANCGKPTARMIMSTIERMITSCLPAFANTIDKVVKKGMISVGDMTDVAVEDAELSIGSSLKDAADELVRLAKRLPEEDAKTQKLLDIVDKTLTDDESGKLLVFSYFIDTLDYIVEKTKEHGARVGLITGSTDSDERDQLRERFRLPKSDPNAIDVLFSSEVGCEGLDYEFCSRMVNYDIPWNPMTIEQRIGRIDRFGQKSEKVRIYNFITKDTIEEKIFFRCFERLGIFNDTIGDLEEVLGDIEDNLTSIAFDLDLTESQQIEKAQQSADNAIRDNKEQEALESTSKDLFVLDMEADDEAVESDRAIQMGLMRHLVQGYLEREHPGVEGTLIGSSRVKLRMFRSDKQSMHNEIYAMRRGGKVDLNSSQYKLFMEYLTGEQQTVILEFDGSVELEDSDVQFASLSHPLVVLALNSAPADREVLHVDLQAPAGGCAPGTYFFGCYRWEEKGFRETSDLKVALVDAASHEAIDISTTEFEQALLKSKPRGNGSSADVSRLNEEIFRKRSLELERLRGINADVIRRRLSTLEQEYMRKISEAERRRDVAENQRIRTMRAGEVDRLKAKLDAKREEIRAIPSVDIVVSLFAVGTIELG